MSTQFEQFREEAINYCTFIENHSCTEEEFVDRLQLILITLYKIASQLPEVESDADCNGDISDSDIGIYLPKITNLLPFQYYNKVLAPFDFSDIETGCGDLYDDIGDIYKDLKRELYYLNSTDLPCKKHGCWMVRFDFDYHWGEHCIDALNAIHHFKLRI